jgi:phage protein D
MPGNPFPEIADNPYNYYEGRQNSFPGRPGSDPWHATPIQGNRRKVICDIWINGHHVTDRLDPYLISVTVRDMINGHDECSIELDDRNGQVPMPPMGAALLISMGWHSEYLVGMFHGYITDVASAGSRGPGRRLFIQGKGISSLDDSKTMFQQAWGEGAGPGQEEGQKIPVSQVVQDMAKNAGFSATVGPGIGSISRDYWSSMNESLQHGLGRLARELGGVFKMNGKSAVLTDFGMNGAGQWMGTIDAIWGENLIQWNIHPFIGKPQYGNMSSQMFNMGKAQFESIAKGVQGMIPFGGASGAAQNTAHTVPNETVGGQQNQGEQQVGDRQEGTGYVMINGEPKARAGMFCEVHKVRPGVDGRYGIKQADHIYSRSGYTTRLTLEKPMGYRDAAVAWAKPRGPAGLAPSGPISPFHPGWLTPQEQIEANERVAQAERHQREQERLNRESQEVTSGITFPPG